MIKHWDIVVCASVVSVLAFLNTSWPEWHSIFRIILGLLNVVVIPGYLLTLGLFPKKTDLDPIERAALSLGLSIAVVPLLGLVLNYTPWGIRLPSITVAISAVCLVLSWLAYYRRRAAGIEQAFTINLQQRHVQLNTLLLVLSVTGVVTVAGFASSYRPKETFTEFYILGPDKKLEGYPTNVRPGQPFIVWLGVTNHEGKDMRYELFIPGAGLVTVLLKDSATWEREFSLVIPNLPKGSQKIEFSLHRSGELSAYRKLHIFVNVE